MSARRYECADHQKVLEKLWSRQDKAKESSEVCGSVAYRERFSFSSYCSFTSLYDCKWLLNQSAPFSLSSEAPC